MGSAHSTTDENLTQPCATRQSRADIAPRMPHADTRSVWRGVMAQGKVTKAQRTQKLTICQFGVLSGLASWREV